MKKFFLCTLALLLLSLFTPQSANAATLHAFIIADTKDHYVGDSIYQDFNLMRKEVVNISQLTGLSLHEIALIERQVNPDRILAELLQLKSEITADDVVLFYYSGHGFRTTYKDWQRSPWPNLYFTLRRDAPLEYETISNLIQSYHPRLFIMIAEVCNNYLPQMAPPSFLRPETLRPTPPPINLSFVTSNYRALFLKKQGTILVTSSSAGEFAFCDIRGGYYTNAFLRNLREVTNQNMYRSDWYHLIQKCSYDLTMNDNQRPYYNINVR